MCASRFLGSDFQKYRNYLPAFTVLVVIVSILSPVLPYELKVAAEAQKAYHLAGLIFFALVYGLLFLFYCGDACYQPELPNNSTVNRVHDIISANKVLSVVAFLSAIPSAALYGKDKIDFELSLWVS
jgi:hypothetical protein